MAITIGLCLSWSRFEAQALPLSAGDRMRVAVIEGDIFSGEFEVNLDGTIQIPYLQPLMVKGVKIDQVAALITETLVNEKLIQPEFAQVSVTILRWAPVQVSVAGATFQPGQVLINDRSSDDKAQQVTQTSGDYAPDRFLSAAIRSAGGIAPTADVRNIKVIRDQQEQVVDLSGIFSGEPVDDVPLIAGDLIVVPSLATLQADLVRPSQITPPGIQISISNLTVPASSNSSSSIDSAATTFVYGSRFSQAVVAANCVGGTRATNANRHAVLVRTDRLSGQTEVWDRPIEELIRNSQDHDANPFLMPDDGVACYDSTVSEARDTARSIVDFILPFSLIFR